MRPLNTLLTVILIILIGYLVIVHSSDAVEKPRTEGIRGDLIPGAGIFVTQVRQLQIYQQSGYHDLVIRLLPLLPTELNDCQKEVVTEYNNTVSQLLQPIKTNLDTLLADGNTKEADIQPRFIGAIIATGALAVATVAEVTAAQALSQSKTNAQNILKLRDSIQATNQAVFEISQGLEATATVLSKLQTELNENIIPSLNNLSCAAMGNRLGVSLSLYLTLMTTLFGDQITNPVLTPISYSTLSAMAGGHIGPVMSKILAGSVTSQLGAEQLIASGLIQSQVVGYDSQYQLLVIRVNLVRIQEVQNTRVVSLRTLAVNRDGGLYRAQVPPEVVERSGIAERFYADDCVLTTTDYICSSIRSSRLNPELVKCLSGALDSCTFERESALLSTPFFVYNKAVVANCKAATCRCNKPPSIIAQYSASALVTITTDTCADLEIEGYRFNIQTESNSWVAPNFTVSTSQIVSVDPIDISSDIAKINNSIEAAREQLELSNQILSRINPRIVNDESLIAIIVTIVVLSLLVVGLIIVLGVMYKNLKKVQRAQAAMMMQQMSSSQPVTTKLGTPF
uniref:Fusion glycoprotein F0 n=1 Tax=avian paramyxovirus 4 TaxID=28274 RepID=A0A127II42_9MONO|nr:fusion protein [Avian paramyxovirus 4]AMO03815.1 fusion protein [Avian paramyxovirus 4]AMO03816.1 fusion protein [Avian paramyxovirus 4]